MEREQIIRTDFPPTRKGWDPNAVRDHLEAVASSMPAAATPVEPTLAGVAVDRIRSVLEAAEVTAEEIRSSAQSDADAKVSAARAEAERILADARAESERVVGAADADARAHVAGAKQGVDGVVEEAERLRSEIASLGGRISGASPLAEVPGPVIVPEPTPPTIPEPTPDPVPEPTPDPTPDPMPDPAPEPTPDPAPPELPDDPGPLAPPVPEPAPTPPAAGSSTEDLIAQLRAASPAAPAANGSPVAPAISGSDLGAARLVAMNMALDGSTREQIAAQVETEFGAVPDLDGLLDEVLARAER